MNEEQKKMTPLPTGEVSPSIFAINNIFVNFFIIKQGGKTIAIDAGADPTLSLKEMQTIEVSPADIDTVLLTHDHGDHTALLSQFSNAKVYAFNEKIFKHENITPTKVSHGDKFNLQGLDIEVIHTPGHKWDHVCYLLNNSLLIAGDTMSIKNGKIALFNEVYNEDNDLQQKNIDELMKISDIKKIITSHYGVLELS